MVSTSRNPSRGLQAAGVACLLVVLALQLAFSARRESQTRDEACHIFAGYNYWKNADFGDNPEHPPLVKLLATLPLLPLPLNVPPHPGVFSKEEDFLTATQFVYSNGAEMILFRTRMAAALLTLLLGPLVFAAAKEMFGPIPAFIALTLLVFEPNMLAHGAVVTTDVGFSCCLLATVYAFYRYVKKTSVVRLALTGLAAGLGLATKHSAILIPPILLALALCISRTRTNFGAAFADLPVSQRLQRRLGTATLGGEEVSQRAAGKELLVRLLRRCVVEPAYYGVPCNPLTTMASVWLQPSIEVPASVDGPVLISAGVLSGYEFGPGELNPYDQFQHIRPTAVIEDGLFVFDGHFDIPLAAALNHVTRAQLAVQGKHLDEALSEAQAAVALAPRSVQAQAELGDVLRQLNRPEESRQAFQKALDAAETIQPEFHSGWIPGLKRVALQRR